MSTAAAPEAEVKPKKGKKMLVVIVLAVVVLAAGAGGGWFYMKSRAETGEAPVAKVEPPHPPTYLAMEPMTVNLADPGGDRFAQLGVTVELSDEKAADKIKSYLPSIRNAVLLIASQRTTEELLTRRGKERLARDIAIEVGRPLGFAEEMTAEARIADAEARRADAAAAAKTAAATAGAASAPAAAASAPAASAPAAAAGAVDEVALPKAEAKKVEAKKADHKEGGNPVRGVLFSSFIIQ